MVVHQARTSSSHFLSSLQRSRRVAFASAPQIDRQCETGWAVCRRFDRIILSSGTDVSSTRLHATFKCAFICIFFDVVAVGNEDMIPSIHFAARYELLYVLQTHLVLRTYSGISSMMMRDDDWLDGGSSGLSGPL